MSLEAQVVRYPDPGVAWDIRISDSGRVVLLYDYDIDRRGFRHTRTMRLSAAAMKRLPSVVRTEGLRKLDALYPPGNRDGGTQVLIVNGKGVRVDCAWR